MDFGFPSYFTKPSEARQHLVEALLCLPGFGFFATVAGVFCDGAMLESFVCDGEFQRVYCDSSEGFFATGSEVFCVGGGVFCDGQRRDRHCDNDG